jgi:hypothetical protein
VRFVGFDGYGKRDVREVLLESQVSCQTADASADEDDLHVRVGTRRPAAIYST